MNQTIAGMISNLNDLAESEINPLNSFDRWAENILECSPDPTINANNKSIKAFLDYENPERDNGK